MAEEQSANTDKGAPSENQTAESTEGRYFTIRQVAEEFLYSRTWILQLVQQGRIKGIKPTGITWRIPASEVERIRKEGLPPPPRPTPASDASAIHVEKEHLDRVTSKPKEKKEPESEENNIPWPFNLMFK